MRPSCVCSLAVCTIQSIQVILQFVERIGGVSASVSVPHAMLPNMDVVLCVCRGLGTTLRSGTGFHTGSVTKTPYPGNS